MFINYSILYDSKIPYETKKPFASLLNELYLFTERDSLVSVSTLANDEKFWTHVKQCGILINAMNDVIQESSNKEIIRIRVKALVTQFISLSVSYNILVMRISVYLDME